MSKISKKCLTYAVNFLNCQLNIDFNKLQKSIVEISSDFIISIVENDVVCETIKYFCKTAKYI